MASLSDLVGGTFADGVAKIISLFKVDPNLAAANAEKVVEIQSQMQQKVLDTIAREDEAASANIQAEEKSGDKYTARARPTFMYIVEGILAWNYVLCPLTHKWTGLSPLDLPSNLLELFGVCITGYVGARSLDKFMALEGDSQLTLPGVSISNKSKGK